MPKGVNDRRFGIWHSAFDIDTRRLVQRAALGVAAGGATILAYRNGLDNPFIFDDRATVLLNPALAAPWQFGAALRDLPHPAVSVTYAIDRALWGFSSFGFHVGNAALHVIVVGLLYGWCTRTLDERGRPEWPAFLAATLFGVHPLMSAAVGYVSARTEILAAAGFITALTFARRAIARSSTASSVGAAAAGVVAIASSAAAVALPLVILAFDAWVLREPGWRRRAARVYVPAMVVATATTAWWYFSSAAPAGAESSGALARLLTASVVAWRYVWLFALPYGQSPVHAVRTVTSVFDPIALAALAGIAASVAAAMMMRRSRPLVALGLVWFIGTLVPLSGVFGLRDAMAEHRMYLPAAGLVLAAAAALAEPIARRRVLRLAGYALLTACVLATRARNHAWAEPLDAWRDLARREPAAWQIRLQLAEALREAGGCDAALAEYAAALQLNPQLADARAGREACERARRSPAR